MPCNGEKKHRGGCMRSKTTESGILWLSGLRRSSPALEDRGSNPGRHKIKLRRVYQARVVCSYFGHDKAAVEMPNPSSASPTTGWLG